jgi:hypothetical protein
MTKLAERFDVSGTYMARICSVLRVPRPPRGYWAKLAVGKAPEPESLPQAEPGDQLTWSKDGDLGGLPPPKPLVVARVRVPRIGRPVTGTHGLIRDAKSHFETGRKIDEGEHLKPFKKLLVDVTVSKAALDKALAFANALFNALESAGHRVVLASNDAPLGRDWQEIDEHEIPPKKKRDRYDNYSRLWSPHRPTVVYIGDIAIGLAIIEMTASIQLRYVNGKYIPEADYVPPKASRHHIDTSWTTTKDLPCGRLRLIAYSPYSRVSWSHRWQEVKGSSLTQELPSIVQGVEAAADILIAKLAEAGRQAEIARQRQLREEEARRWEEDARRIQKSIQDSKDHPLKIIGSWSEVTRLEQFFEGVSERAAGVPAARRIEVEERLKLAREFIGTQDPLDFFLSWKTPTERYQPLGDRPDQTVEIDPEDEDESEDDADDLS